MYKGNKFAPSQHKALLLISIFQERVTMNSANAILSKLKVNPLAGGRPPKWMVKKMIEMQIRVVKYQLFR